MLPINVIDANKLTWETKVRMRMTNCLRISISDIILPLGFELYRVVLRADTVGDSNNVLGLKVLLCDCENPETDVNLKEIQ